MKVGFDEERKSSARSSRPMQYKDGGARSPPIAKTLYLWIKPRRWCGRRIFRRAHKAGRAAVCEPGTVWNQLLQHLDAAMPVRWVSNNLAGVVRMGA